MAQVQVSERETPSKPFFVRIYTDNGPEPLGRETVQRGTSLTMVEDDYRETLKAAKAATRRDGKRRWVVVEQVLVEQVIESL